MMNSFSTDTLLFSKWTKESLHELTDRFYLVVSCQRNAQGQLVQVAGYQYPAGTGDGLA